MAWLRSSSERAAGNRDPPLDFCAERDLENVESVHQSDLRNLKVPAPLGEEGLQQGLQCAEGGRLFEFVFAQLKSHGSEPMPGQQLEERFAERRPSDARDGPPLAGFRPALLDRDA